MGCTSSQTSEPHRHIVELPDGCIASDLKVRVRTKADGHHLNPSGLLVEAVGNQLFVKGVKRHSPIDDTLSELQRKSSSLDFSVERGEEIIGVNGHTDVDGMLRALHWQRVIVIQFRRQDFAAKSMEATIFSNTSTRSSKNSQRSRLSSISSSQTRGSRTTAASDTMSDSSVPLSPSPHSMASLQL
mmetsp:Transcript_15867/g.28973  ORF Transcript_15867/g.28973 Transcript_15867/m.28973 type:complete len:186 (-) Transcript_15867:89-646(-)